MKKLYLLLVALCVATIPALAADWYLAGEGISRNGENCGWGDIATFGLSKVSDHIYKLDGLTFTGSNSSRFKVKPSGKWDGNFASNGSEMNEIPAEAYIAKTDTQDDIRFTFSAENVTLSINTETNELLLTTDGTTLTEPMAEWLFYDEGKQSSTPFVYVDGEPTLKISGFSNEFKIVKKLEGQDDVWYGTDADYYTLSFNAEYYLKPNSGKAHMSQAVMDYDKEVTITIVNTAADQNQIIIKAAKEPRWFLIGDAFKPGWVLPTEYEMTKSETDDNIYTIHVENIKLQGRQMFKFVAPVSIEPFSWDGAKAVGVGSKDQVEYDQQMQGAFFDGSAGGNLLVGHDKKYETFTGTIELNVRTAQFIFKAEQLTSEGEKWYFHDSGNNVDYPFDDNLKATVKNLSDKFQIKKVFGETTTTYGQDANDYFLSFNMSDNYYLKPNKGDALVKDDVMNYAGDVIITIVNTNAADGQITIMATTVEDTKWYIIGDYFFNWGNGDKEGALSKEECLLEPTAIEGVYTKTFADFKGGNFKFVMPAGQNLWNGEQIAPVADGTANVTIEYDKVITGTKNKDGEKNFYMDADQNITIVLDTNNNTFIVSKASSELTADDELYLVGDFYIYDAQGTPECYHFNKSIKMTKTVDGDNVSFTANDVDILPANAYWWNFGQADAGLVNYGRYIIVSKAIEEVLAAQPAAAPARAAAAADVPDHGLNGLDLGKRFTVAADGSLTTHHPGLNDNVEPMQVPAGRYNITVTAAADGTKTLTTTGGTQTGIDAIDAAQAEVEYYNLQGIRVAEPTNGIYLRRQGTKVSKVLVK